jgi:hypothetical protein
VKRPPLIEAEALGVAETGRIVRVGLVLAAGFDQAQLDEVARAYEHLVAGGLGGVRPLGQPWMEADPCR